jgi:F-type H+-transporting ATPase subunit epsilon
MKLTVLAPTEVVIEAQKVTKIIAEAENGSFCILPRHTDFLASLVAGILAFSPEVGDEEFLAIDEGILVKCHQEVFVCTFHAIKDNSLERLKNTVEQKFRSLDEREKLIRSALTKFEVGIMRRFKDLGS